MNTLFTAKKQRVEGWLIKKRRTSIAQSNGYANARIGKGEWRQWQRKECHS